MSTATEKLEEIDTIEKAEKIISKQDTIMFILYLWLILNLPGAFDVLMKGILKNPLTF